MKKILFSCLLALGIGVNAQYDFKEDFEENQIGLSHFGGASLNTTNYCSAVVSGALTYTTSVNRTGWFIRLQEISDFYSQTDNGQKINVSFSYKKAANLTGTLYVMYAEFDEEANAWNIVTVGNGVVLTSAASLASCNTVSATIPAGTFDPNKTYGIGTWLQTTNNTTGALYIDDIIVKQDIATSVPSCTAFTYPTNGSTIPGGTAGLTWTTVDGAANYKVTVGTTPGGSDVLNTTVIGSTSLLNTPLPASTTLYAKIVPTNNVGDAVGCQEITFMTNNVVGHCGPITSSAPTVIAPIKSVTFAGVTNTSDPTATTLGSFPVHQDFKNIEFPVTNNLTTLPLSIIGTNNATASNGWAMAVFIDWNNDGSFEGVGEQYFNTFETKASASGFPTSVPITGNITIPAGTSLGKKTMRIKYNFQHVDATTINDALATGCANMTNGQVEDYTIDYKEFMAVSDINKKSVSVYPNPFTDVLNISDVKGVKSVSVNDVSGREVKSLAPSAELNLSNLKAGLYIVNLKMEDGSVKTFKAIKK